MNDTIPIDAVIYIIDDDPAMCKALMLTLKLESICCEVFNSAEDFIAHDKYAAVGCIIADMQMTGMDGLQLLAQLRAKGVELPIIFLTGYGSIPLSVNAIKNGAEDFLTKPITREQLLASVQAATQKSLQQVEHIQQKHNAKARLASLTERELEIMALAVAGHTNKVIARQLEISHRTVEHHKAAILRKTGANSLLELANLAKECDLPTQSAA